jgi:NADPH:quinone reductase-like Zn-dependent oxidoreductase
LAKREGASVIAVLRSKPAATQTVTGTTSIIDKSVHVADAEIYLSECGGFPGLAEAVRALPLIQQRWAGQPDDSHHRRGATLAFDVLGGEVIQHVLSSLSTRGRLVFIAMPMPHAPVQIDGLECYRQELKLVGVNSLLLSAVECAALLQEIRAGFDSGELAPRDATATMLVSPYTHVGQAYSDVINGRVKGKLVFEFEHA